MMNLDQDGLNVRWDDYSLQITSRRSPRFYVRLIRPTSHQAVRTYTDFILEPSDTNQGVMAMELADVRFPQNYTKILFENIYPCYGRTGDKAELERRHDQLVAVARTHLGVIRANLNITNGLFETIVEIV